MSCSSSSLDTLPVEKTEYVLRPLAERDIPHIAALGNNRKIWLNMPDSFPFPYTEKDAAEWLQMPDQKINWAITLQDQFIGSIGIDPLGPNNAGVGQVGYWMGEPYWGQGIATNALKVVTHHALTRMNYHRLEATVFGWNTASFHMLEKVHYRLEGILKNRITKDGTVLDEHLFARLSG